jgi:hypothetical protein
LSSEDRFDGMEEMDDFTVREGNQSGPYEVVGPDGVYEEDITGAAGIDRPTDPAEDLEGDEPTLRPRSLSSSVRKS